jgi:hypothetical protein
MTPQDPDKLDFAGVPHTWDFARGELRIGGLPGVAMAFISAPRRTPARSGPATISSNVASVKELSR